MKSALAKSPTTAPVRQARRTSADILARILTGAADEFKERGFASATTAAIANRAEVTEAQLFRYFASKSDLFRESVAKPLDRHFSEFNARMLKDGAATEGREAGIRQYIHELQQFIRDHSGLLMSMIVANTYAAGGGNDKMASLTDYFDCGAAMMAGRVGADAAVDPRLMVRVSFAAVLGSVLFGDLLFPPGLADEDQIEAATIRFVADGINATNKGKPQDV